MRRCCCLALQRVTSGIAIGELIANGCFFSHGLYRQLCPAIASVTHDLVDFLFVETARLNGSRYEESSWRQGSVSAELELLRMAHKADRFRETAKMMLEPWLVEQALARLGGRRLSGEQQSVVVSATRTPWKVRWPPWWEARL